MLQRPNFEDAWRAFKEINVPLSEVGARIGGKVAYNIAQGIFENACTLRLSYVLNRCGSRVTPPYGIEAVSGADGAKYMFRVQDAEKYLTGEWGKPDVEIYSRPLGISAIQNKCGVLLFHVPFSNATGHATLWDGRDCSDHGYFDKAKGYSFWVLPRRYG